jgi:hypothetical protein
VAVRRVEWRLFGFGMMQFLSILARQPALRAPERERIAMNHGRLSATGNAPSSKVLMFQGLIRSRNLVNASHFGLLGPDSQEQG